MAEHNRRAYEDNVKRRMEELSISRGLAEYLISLEVRIRKLEQRLNQ
jgi:hypothetical protein